MRIGSSTPVNHQPSTPAADRQGQQKASSPLIALKSLPTELFRSVLSHMRPEDFSSLKCSSRYWRHQCFSIPTKFKIDLDKAPSFLDVYSRIGPNALTLKLYGSDKKDFFTGFDFGTVPKLRTMVLKGCWSNESLSGLEKNYSITYLNLEGRQGLDDKCLKHIPASVQDLHLACTKTTVDGILAATNITGPISIYLGSRIILKGNNDFGKIKGIGRIECGYGFINEQELANLNKSSQIKSVRFFVTHPSTEAFNSLEKYKDNEKFNITVLRGGFLLPLKDYLAKQAVANPR